MGMHLLKPPAGRLAERTPSPPLQHLPLEFVSTPSPTTIAAKRASVTTNRARPQMDEKRV
jgi:hypothetical protein